MASNISLWIIFYVASHNNPQQQQQQHQPIIIISRARDFSLNTTRPVAVPRHIRTTTVDDDFKQVCVSSVIVLYHPPTQSSRSTVSPIIYQVDPRGAGIHTQEQGIPPGAIESLCRRTGTLKTRAQQTVQLN